MTDPMNPIRDKRVLLDWQQSRLIAAMQSVTHKERSRLAALAAGLDAMSPLKVLARGYSLAYDDKGSLLTSVRTVEAGQKLDLRLADGNLDCTVMKVSKH